MKEQDEDNQAVQVIPEIDPREGALVDRQIATAHAYPRNITKATNNSIAIVQIDQETAETCTYTVPRGGKKISGPSVHLAKILAQNWGNLRVEARVAEVTDKQIVSQAVAWDLESNLAIKIEVRRSILDKFGKRYSDDMVVVTGNAANSIALRNSVFAVIPKAVVDKAYKAAKEKIVGDVSDKNKFIAKRKEVMDRLKDTYNVTEEDILKSIDKASVEHITVDDLATLIGIGTAIKDGDTTVEQAFKGKQTKAAQDEITAQELADLFTERKHLMDPKDIKDAERIIFTPEPNSFKKLQKLLLAIKV